MPKKSSGSLAYHPAADAFPMMDAKRFNELKADIDTHGLRVPIVLCDGKILDGRNRHKACSELEVDIRTEVFTGDPWAYVWSLNGERRDLADDQRYLIWKFCYEHGEEWQAKNQAIQEEANRKRSKAAKGNDNAAKSKKNSRGTKCSPTVSVKPGKAAKAAASKTNAGAVARGDKLAKERPDLAEKVRKGTLKPSEAHRQMKKDEIAKKVSWPAGKYRVIYADPPWSYGNTQPDYFREQRDHYPVMSLSEICALPVSDMALENSVLFLWATSPILEESFQVVKAWGFKYKASFVWDKIKHNMGHYNSVRHEFLLICTRGSCQPDVRKLFDSVVSEERVAHSQKPESFYDIIETLYPHGSRIELFARNARKGWKRFGHQS